MSVEAGHIHKGRPHNLQENRARLQQYNLDVYELDGYTLANTLKKYDSLGMRFRGDYWIRQQSELLAQRSEEGPIGVIWKIVGEGGDHLDQNRELADEQVRVKLPSEFVLKRGSLNDVLKIIGMYREANATLPPVIVNNPDVYILTSTASRKGSEKDLLAVGGFLSDEGIDIKVYPDSTKRLMLGTIPIAYPSESQAMVK